MNQSPASSRVVFFAALLIVMSVSTARAQLKLPFGSKTGNVGQIMLTERNGPWLIMCASFSGDAAQRKAENVVEELRGRYGLKAYLFKRQFDHTEKLVNNAIATWKIDESSASQHHVVKAKMEPASTAKYDEVAVMVGDFPTVDDARAQKLLAKIKTLSAESMDASLTGAAESNLSAERIRKWRSNSENLPGSSTVGRGAFRAAFMLPNPMLPDEYFETQQVDEFVLRLNKKVKHSLLKNQGVYSVRVASFKGDATFDIQKSEAKKRELRLLAKNKQKLQSSKLADAFNKAHLLTQEFRKNGVEAYEFHDRHESYVCLGSFDWIARDDGQGGKVQNPAVVETILKYKGQIDNLPGRPNSIVPKSFRSLAGKKIVLDAQPIPVLVPKIAKQSPTARLFNRFR